jgi:hypothetical protein
LHHALGLIPNINRNEGGKERRKEGRKKRMKEGRKKIKKRNMKQEFVA